MDTQPLIISVINVIPHKLFNTLTILGIDKNLYVLTKFFNPCHIVKEFMNNSET